MTKTKSTPEERKLFREIFFHSFLLEASYNYERQQALGFCLGMVPAIKRFYKTQQEQADALERHMQIFNTTPHVVPAITGIATAMEEEASKNPDFDKESINSVKVSLMGPFAGIGDSFFWGTFRIIATALALPLSEQGSAIAPILFLLIFNIPHMIIRYFSGVIGYRFGTKIMDNVAENDLFQRISKAATIVGLMVIGGMSVTMVKLSTPLSFTMNETVFEIQNYINQIFPMLLPLLYTLLMFSLCKKGKKSTFLLVITIAFGLIGSLLHIL